MSLMSLEDVKGLVPMDEKDAERELEKKGKKIPVIHDEEEDKPYGEK